MPINTTTKYRATIHNTSSVFNTADEARQFIREQFNYPFSVNRPANIPQNYDAIIDNLSIELNVKYCLRNTFFTIQVIECLDDLLISNTDFTMETT